MKVVACIEESAHIVVISKQLRMSSEHESTTDSYFDYPSPRAHTLSLVVAYDKRVKVRVLRNWFCYVFDSCIFRSTSSGQK